MPFVQVPVGVGFLQADRVTQHKLKSTRQSARGLAALSPRDVAVPGMRGVLHTQLAR